MSLIFTLIFLIINTFLFIAHFSTSINTPVTDLIASIPNLFFAISYLIFIFIVNLFKLDTIYKIFIKTTSSILFLIYLIVYIFPPINTLVLNNPANSYTNITICSQNTKKASAIFQDEFWQLIKLQKCDIILLQEVINSTELIQTITERLKTTTKDSYFITNYGEFIVASKYPLKLTYSATSQGFVTTDIQLPQLEIFIINTHIWTPLEPKTPEHDPTLTHEIKPFIIRKEQTLELLSFLRQNYSTTPILIIGDFNMLPTHPFLAKLKRTHFSRITSQKHITPTFSTSIPIIEIDHLFTNRPDIIAKRETYLHNTSDHGMQVIYLHYQKPAGERARTSTGFNSH